VPWWGAAPAPRWLATDGLLAQFGRRRTEARQRYRQFGREGIDQGNIWAGLRQQIYLGDERVVERMQRRAKPKGDKLSIPRAQRRAPAPLLAAIAQKHRNRDDAINAAYATGAYRYREIADRFRLHLATIGRIVRARMLQGEN